LSSVGKDSDNFYAEMVFKSIGAQKKARPGSAEGAAEMVTGVLREMGAFETGVVAKNGSGLFDANRTTPWATVALLRSAHADPSISTEYVAQLAIAGVDGTLRWRLREWADERAIRAKTGTLNDVAALSGYILAPPGRSPIAFAILVNRIPGKVSGTRTSVDRVIETTARELWRERR
jgi:D-alanyl-D-alanine carboxypeptidase/D-alanyl-D-alanine-endopeptidase (penicillin-binding protein 4)